MVSYLREMNQRRDQWLNEKPQFDGSGIELRIATGDLVLFQFMANGDEGDRLIKLYRSHIIPMISKEGKHYSRTYYCPVQSGETEVECPLCVQGHTEIKERMSMWMFVSNILHQQLPKQKPEDKVFQQVPYEGGVYFNEEVGGFKIWHTSAWRDSPWSDILKNAEIYKGLHNFSAQIQVVGSGVATRYKLYALPNSPMVSPDLYTKAQQECQPILDILHQQLTSPVQINPEQTTNQQTQQPRNIGVRTFVPPGQNLPEFKPFPSFGSAATNVADNTLQKATATEETTIDYVPVEAQEEEKPLKKLF